MQDAETQFVRRGVNVGDEAVIETGNQPFFHDFQVGWRFIGGKDDLTALIDQGIKSVEEFLLGRFLDAD